jgi:hypothetical protein
MKISLALIALGLLSNISAQAAQDPAKAVTGINDPKKAEGSEDSDQVAGHSNDNSIPQSLGGYEDYEYEEGDDNDNHDDSVYTSSTTASTSTSSNGVISIASTKPIKLPRRPERRTVFADVFSSSRKHVVLGTRGISRKQLESVDLVSFIIQVIQGLEATFSISVAYCVVFLLYLR